MTTTDVPAAQEHEIRTPDGRTLHVYEAGDPRGELVLVHHGTPGCGSRGRIVRRSLWITDADGVDFPHARLRFLL